MAGIPGAGGKKGRSGRKSKAEELGLVALLENSFGLEKRQAVIERLADIATGHDPKAAVSAASLLFGYAYGKPREHVELSGELEHTHKVVRVPPKVKQEEWPEVLQLKP